MQALVTGGAGFIGQHVVAALAARGARVRVLDLAEPRGLPDSAEVLRGSVLDGDLLARAMKGCDWIFHLAAIPHLWIRNKRDYLQVNLEGTRAVLATAAALGVKRFVHTSTEAVLAGTADAELRVDGTVPPRLADMPGAYSRSKLLAEEAVLAAAAAGLPTLVVSPTAPLGPGDAALTPPTRLLLDLLNGRLPAYLDCMLNLADVRDIAEGHVLAAEQGTVGMRYLLGGENLRFSALAARLAAMTGLAMPRRRIPWWLAWASAAIGETLADHVTHKAPAASLNGVRLVRRPLLFDSRLARGTLGWHTRPLAQTLADAVADLARRGLVTRKMTLAPETAQP